MATRTPYSNPKPPGFLYAAAVVFVAITVLGLLVALFLMLQPQRLDDVDGLDAADLAGRDVAAVLRESQQRQVPVTLTEEEINRWLARTLVVKQGGRFEDSVKFKRVAVRLSENIAEVVMEREIGGRGRTVSMFVSIEQVRNGDSLRTEMNLHGGSAGKLPPILMGGRFGRLIVPQGFLRLIMPSYEGLAEALPEELENGFSDMVLIRIEDKQLVLDPRRPRRDSGARPGEID